MKRAAALGLTTAAVGGGLGALVPGSVEATNAAFTPARIAERAAAQVAEVPRGGPLVAGRSPAEGRTAGKNPGNPFLPAAIIRLGWTLPSRRLASSSAFI